MTTNVNATRAARSSSPRSGECSRIDHASGAPRPSRRPREYERQVTAAGGQRPAQVEPRAVTSEQIEEALGQERRRITDRAVGKSHVRSDQRYQNVWHEQAPDLVGD